MTSKRNDNREAARQEAANDDDFDGDGGPPDAPRGASVEMIERMLDAPPDLPLLPLAKRGLKESLAALSSQMPLVHRLCSQIVNELGDIPADDGEVASAEAAAMFAKRRGRHGHYLSLIALGIHAPRTKTDEAAKAKAAPVAVTIGAWAVHRALDGWAPPQHQFARAAEVLFKPDGAAARSWTREERERYASDNVHRLAAAISEDRAVAARLGLVLPPRVNKDVDPVVIFNRRFRRRWANLLDYKSMNGQAAAGGHGTLSPAALKRAGRELLGGFHARDLASLHVGVEIVSHLTSDLVQQLPVQLKDKPPAGALAWIDLPQGEYCYVLFQIIDRGARPDPGTEGLYQTTTQVVRIRMTPPLADALRALATSLDGDFATISGLLGEVSHGPHAAVAGRGRYRFTAARIQASLPTLLVQDGVWRWAAAITTSSPFVVSRGRPAYSAIWARTICSTTEAACAALGWPSPASTGDTTLVGGFVLPKTLAVVMAFRALAEEADAHSVPGSTYGEVVACLNAHAAFLALLLALAFALRKRVVYPLPTAGLRSGSAIQFSDKDVHEIDMPPIPMLQIVRDAMQGWERLIQQAIQSLEGVDSDEARSLRQRLIDRLQDNSSVGCVFTINAAGDLEPAGVSTWRDRLPPSMCLIGNFGRHFWPIHLAELGVTQVDMDILMRHQMPALHPNSTHNVRSGCATHETLVAAMTQVVRERLGVTLPRALSPGKGV